MKTISRIYPRLTVNCVSVFFHLNRKFMSTSFFSSHFKWCLLGLSWFLLFFFFLRLNNYGTKEDNCWNMAEKNVFFCSILDLLCSPKSTPHSDALQLIARNLSKTNEHAVFNSLFTGEYNSWLSTTLAKSKTRSFLLSFSDQLFLTLLYLFNCEWKSRWPCNVDVMFSFWGKTSDTLLLHYENVLILRRLMHQCLSLHYIKLVFNQEIIH